MTETVIETRDAKETATGTVTATKIGTETGTATDVCHSPVVIAFLIADNHSHISSQLEAGVAAAAAAAITGSLKTASDAATYVSLVFSL